jgi:hypothetical protein
MKEEIITFLLSRKREIEDKKEALTYSRYYRVYRPRIKELDYIIEKIQTNQLCVHELKRVRDSHYPFNPIRCIKCGYEP